MMNTSSWIISTLLVTALNGLCWGFQSHPHGSVVARSFSRAFDQRRLGNYHATITTALNVMTERDPDIVEMMMGGERYEMVPLPDRMCDTTVFVGNFCEFVHDEDLSQLFQSVSTLHSLPACVVRKANMQSLRYGFVSFLTEEEKEAAILRFHGSEWRGKQIKVEPIRDNPKCRRVRVPERMVSYVSGSLKKTRTGRVNSMRNARGDEDVTVTSKRKKKALKKKRLQAVVDSTKNSKKSSSIKKSAKPKSATGRLSVANKQELERAAKKGFLTLDGRNAGHGSLASLCSSEALKGSKMAAAHRKWCDERTKPNIILYKASGRNSQEVLLDHLIVDLSPLRDQVSFEWTAEILNAAEKAGMDLQLTQDSQECSTEVVGMVDNASNGNVAESTNANSAVTKKSISRLPFVSMGFFVGERSNAKAMAKELALLWDIPEIDNKIEEGDDEIDLNRPYRESKSRYKNHHKKLGKKAVHNVQDRRTQRRKSRHDWEQSMSKYL